MLLVEVDGRKILYSGDFRLHGRKAGLVEGIMQTPPKDINLLILEGTNLGTEKPTISESQLEEKFVALAKKISGRMFVSWSGQNIDRTVTLYRAAKRSGRQLVIDLYTAEVLDLISDGTRLPRAGFDNLKGVITNGLRKHYEQHGKEDFVKRMAVNGISARALEGSNHIIMARDGLLRDYISKNVSPTSDDAFSYSMWKGYLDKPNQTLDWFKTAGTHIEHLHTSGHASGADLRKFAKAISADAIIPVHGQNWDDEQVGFDRVVRLTDSEVYCL
jgi:ribonuclease J